MRSAAERDTDISSASLEGREEDRGRRVAGRLPEASLAAIALYGVVTLVLLPEGSPSPLSLGAALLAIAGVTAVAVAVARWAPAWVRGLGMLLDGFAMVAVLAGVVVGRLARNPSSTPSEASTSRSC